MEIMKGTILRFAGTWMSGLGFLVVDTEDRGIIQVPCDNAPTVRALDGAFGGVIDRGHTVNQDAIVGREIYFSYDDFGMVLGGFTPVEDASEELIEAYEAQ